MQQGNQCSKCPKGQIPFHIMAKLMVKDDLSLFQRVPVEGQNHYRPMVIRNAGYVHRIISVQNDFALYAKFRAYLRKTAFDTLILFRNIASTNQRPLNTPDQFICQQRQKQPDPHPSHSRKQFYGSWCVVEQIDCAELVYIELPAYPQHKVYQRHHICAQYYYSRKTNQTCIFPKPYLPKNYCDEIE